MGYSKTQFVSVLNAVRTVSVFETSSIVLRGLIKDEINIDTIKALRKSLLNNNCELVDKIIQLSHILSEITGDSSTVSIAKIIEEFKKFTGKDPNEPYDMTVRLLNYYDYPSKEA